VSEKHRFNGLSRLRQTRSERKQSNKPQKRNARKKAVELQKSFVLNAYLP
jgi:hypothetical protein